MKNLILLMMTVLLVNVSVHASADMKLGEGETLCPYINGAEGADQVFSSGDSDSDDLSGGTVISA